MVRRLVFASAVFAAGALTVFTGERAGQDPEGPAYERHDWPQWRGPDGDGISRESGWRIEGRPRDLWTRNVGIGYSSFAIQDGRLFTMGHDFEQKLDTVFCLDAATGETIWRFTYPTDFSPRLQDHPGGSLTTPAVSRGRVYTSNREGQLFCFDSDDGEVLFSKDLAEEYGPVVMAHGYSGSPLVIEDHLILSMGGKTIAVDRESGETLWQTRNFGEGSYATPVEFDLRGRSRLAVFTGAGLVVLDRATGDVVNFHEWRSSQGNVNAATPVVTDTRVFISSAYTMGCAMLDLAGKDPSVLWKSQVMRTKMTACVLWDGHLYGFSDSILKCIDLDGNTRWRTRGLGMGSLIASDDKLIAMSSSGELVVIAATPDEYRELSRRKVLDGGSCYTAPVLCGGRIYCRNSLGDIVCRDHRPAAKAEPTR